MSEKLTLKNLFITINGQFTGYCDLYNLNHSEQLLLMHFIEGLIVGIKTVYGDIND
ncbi:MAG: hypothetical protein IKF82_00585 [Bacilli bacterium]|nr:hypothetical protein [Bacilli bacterium]